MKRLGVVIFVALLFSRPALAADLAGKKLTWYRMDFPPVYISDGPYRAQEMQGPVDEVIKRELEKHGYTVTFSTANHQRIVHDLQAKQPVCTSILLRSPEYEQTVEYSIPHSLALPGGVI